MSKFKCSICGFIYDEAVGLPEKGIAPGTKWEDVPHNFVCPLCGAPKAVFEEVKVQQDIQPIEQAKEQPIGQVDFVETEADEEEDFESLRELSAGELSAICSNLARGCEKQHLTEDMNSFSQLADYYKSKVVVQGGLNLEDGTKLLKSDLDDGFPKANSAASAKQDRGALRALVWSEKVSMVIRSLLERYSREGNAMLEDKKIYVCDICGFVYVGNDLPEICPICKVPKFKILQIGRR
jgi:rubredoxin